MNKRTYILVFLLLLAGFTSELSAQKKPKKAKQEISVVSGQVVDSSGIPVAGALVTAMEGAYFARTDADGAFSVKSGAADYILIEAEGYEPKEVYLPDLAAGQAIALEASPYRSGSADRVELPFGTLTDRRVVGAVNDIDMDRYKDKLSDYGLDGVLQAEGFGVFGAKDVRGMGYTILIDGLVRDGSNSVASLSDMLNADEVERITVLKDAASRLLYGSYADKGIILIKTRRGEAHKRIMNFSYETSFGIPKAQPEYLRAADYMILYNEALRNDGGNPMYSYQDIENARAGVDPVKYPDQDYYSSEFLRGFKPQNRVSAEFIGGSRVAQYYLNAGFYNTKSIVSMGESDKQRTNRFNVRGNVDVNINKYIKVSLDAAAIFNSYHGPNWKNGNFWRLSTENPVNSYPFLIPVDRLDMEDEYTKTALEDAELQRSVIGGKYLVGGNNNNNPNYLRNPYGDLYLGGYANTMDRMAHINVGIDVDFSWLTEGLSFKTYFGTDNYNKYTTTQNNSYASYEPAFGDDGTIRIANIYGSNDFVGSQTMTDTGFYRRLGWNNALSYDRTFSGRHQLSAVLMSTMHHYKESGATHAEKSVNFGGRVNYAFADKYVAEYSGAYIGSTFLSRGNRWGYAQGGGLGWIVSEEEFLRGSRWLNYLTIKVSYANTKSDSGMSNYIDTDIYDPGANYNYGDGTGQNALMTLQRGNPAISWVQRHDVNVGMEFSLFRHALSGEVNYFNSLRFDEITRRTSQLPGVLGSSVFIPNENYNSRRQSGIEARITYRRHFGDFGLEVGADMIWYKPRYVNYSEIDYPEHLSYLSRAGRPTDAIWGLQADGFYTQEEIDLMNAGGAIARPTYGTVQAGDIKYRDVNGDMRIDDEDFTVIGNTHARFAYGLKVTLTWRNFELFAYMSAQTGATKDYRSDAYYAVYGPNAKYPVHLIGRWAYDPSLGIDTRATATYPRLTASSSGTTHNYGKTSTFWLARQNYFSIPAVQLSYHLGDKLMKTLRLKDVTIYARATDILLLSPSRDRMILNVGSEFQYAWVHLGVKLKF